MFYFLMCFNFSPDRMMQNSVVILQNGGFWNQAVQNLTNSQNLVLAKPVQWLPSNLGPVMEDKASLKKCPFVLEPLTTS